MQLYDSVDMTGQNILFYLNKGVVTYAPLFTSAACLGKFRHWHTTYLPWLVYKKFIKGWLPSFI